MRTLMLAGAVMALAFENPLAAHGGKYRGPEDVVPPGARPTGAPKTPGGGKNPGHPVTPGPGVPTGPGPSHPVTGGPPGGGAGIGGTRTGPRGIDVGDDLTRWVYWWEFHKDPYLQLKDSLAGFGPKSGSPEVWFGRSTRDESRDVRGITPADRKDRILPRLKQAIDSSDQRDITSSCLIAMAKLGIDHDSFTILPEFRARLRSRDQEVRETAALAMGISQLPDALDDLLAIAGDSQHGRDLVMRSEVDDRTRAFACYGVGLVAWASTDAGLKSRALAAVAGVLQDQRVISRDVQIAAINALRLLRPTDGEKDLRGQALAALRAFADRDLGRGRELVQAHVPPAMATLVGRGGDAALELAQRLADDLTPKRDRAAELRQSSVLALGAICASPEEDARFRAPVAALQAACDADKDLQTRLFSLMALAQIGGEGNRAFLLQVLARGKDAIERPWAGLALGVFEFERMQRSTTFPTPDATIGTALQQVLRDSKNPDLIGSTAVALGLCRHVAAEDLLRELLQRHRAKEDVAGYVALGLALMGATGATTELHDIVQSSARKPDLLRQAAIALGKLGDKRAAETLQRMLAGGAEDQPNLAKLAAISSALGFIGDRRSIDTLSEILLEDRLTPLSRAFAAVALGNIGDKEPLPWNSKIAFGMNYRAAVPTLTDRKGGVLDIL